MRIAEHFRTLLHWLQLVCLWIKEHCFYFLALTLTAVLIIYAFCNYDDKSFKIASTIFQIYGTFIAISNIKSVINNFKKIINSFPQYTIQNRKIELCMKVTCNMSAGGRRSYKPDKNDTFEKQISDLQNGIDALQSQIDYSNTKFLNLNEEYIEKLAMEKTMRAESDQKIKDELKKITDNYTNIFIGAIWLMIGIILSAYQDIIK